MLPVGAYCVHRVSADACGSYQQTMARASLEDGSTVDRAPHAGMDRVLSCLPSRTAFRWTLSGHTEGKPNPTSPVSRFRILDSVSFH